jgi:nucleoid DNA-binding protein
LFKTSKLALLEYIKDQLLFKESVTLPGLGSFEIRKNASYIQGKKIIPPIAKIVFNPDKSLDDGSLAKSIAAAEDTSQEEAGQKVLEYIDEILFALNKGEEFVFEGFGKIYRDSDNVFRFDKDPAYQIEFESFGLESFELDPIEDLLQKEKTTESEQSL